MTTIYFIRHGQTSFGAENHDHLSATGTLQIQLLTDYFMDMEAYFPVIYSGSKKIQIDTAKVIESRHKDNDVQTNFNILPELNDFNIFNLIAFHKDDIIQSDPSLAKDLEYFGQDCRSFQNVFIKLLQWSLSEKCDEMKVENFNIFKDRIHSAVQKIIDESKQYNKVAVVTSGDVLAIVMQMIQGITDSETIDLVWNFYNASITMCYVDSNQLELRLYNSVVHLKNQGNNDLLSK